MVWVKNYPCAVTQGVPVSSQNAYIMDCILPGFFSSLQILSSLDIVGMETYGEHTTVRAYPADAKYGVIVTADDTCLPQAIPFKVRVTGNITVASNTETRAKMALNVQSNGIQVLNSSCTIVWLG